MTTYTPADYAAGLIAHHGEDEARAIAEAMLAALPKVHTFTSTGRAYDACQCSDDLAEDGQTLVIEAECVVGLSGTWPVAVTIENGKLHALVDGANPEACGTAEQIKAACEQARRRGWPIRREFAAVL